MYGNLTLGLMYISGGLVVFLIMFFIMIRRENKLIKKLKQRAKEMDEEQARINQSTAANALKLLEEKDRLIHMTWYYTFVIRKMLKVYDITHYEWDLKDWEYLQATESVPYHETFEEFRKWAEANVAEAKQARDN